MFHVELRQFPHVARAFNLTAEQLDTRILSLWAGGQPVPWEGRRFSPEKARLTIYEAPELRPDEIGMGRGWPDVTRAGNDVTDGLVAQARRRAQRDPALEQLKAEVVQRAQTRPLELASILELSSKAHPQAPLSVRFALAERAIWELLHADALELVDDRGDAVPRPRWQPLLLELSSWSKPSVSVRAPGTG